MSEHQKGKEKNKLLAAGQRYRKQYNDLYEVNQATHGPKLFLFFPCCLSNLGGRAREFVQLGKKKLFPIIPTAHEGTVAE